MSYGRIVFERGEDGAALLTVRRPEKLNALDAEAMQELDDAFGEAAGDARVRGLILTGAGEKAFVAGADIAELAALTPIEAREMARRGQRVFRRLETMGKPSIAAINGYALGGGLELALACTLRVASPNAQLGLPEVKLGLIPGAGGTQRLPRLVGRGPALEMLLTGDPVTAQQALAMGLVHHVVEQASLIAFCRELLARILANSSLAVAAILEAVDAGLSCGAEEGMKIEAAAFGVAASTEDSREGMAAFLEKRKAVFQGK